MLKIGEFSALTGISIHMLRNYDKIGLLKPALVEKMNNYRFYGEQQIVRANHIQVLKSLGFGLKEISEILMDEIPVDRIKSFLEGKIREKEESLSVMERQIARMRQALEDLELQNGYALSVSVKRLPARKVVSFRDVIRDFNEEGLLWERLDMLCRANGVRLGDAQYFSGEIQPDSRCQSAPISMDRAKWLQDIGKSAQCLLPVAGKRTKPG